MNEWMDRVLRGGFACVGVKRKMLWGVMVRH